MKRTWQRLAFASRYGHQPLSELVELETNDLTMYCNAVADLMKGESITEDMTSGG